MTARKEVLARLNGVTTKAQKHSKRWMVGGDFLQRGDSVQIVAWHRDCENGGGWWAWHKLRGFALIFDDHLTAEELSHHLKIMRGQQ